MNALVQAAMLQFWHHGYSATSVADLVAATGVARHGLYEEFGNKHELFCACLAAYQDAVVSPAFHRVEAEGADLEDIAIYFQTQIKAGLSMMPSPPGCLIANTMTELGPHNEEISRLVEAHNDRLTSGFLNALSNENETLSHAELSQLARFLSVSAQGLWSFSRSTDDPAYLTAFADTLLSLIKQRLQS